MLTDVDIANALQPLEPLGYEKVPYDGAWARRPYARRTLAGRTFAVICTDPGIQELLVELDDGRVFTHPTDGAEMFVVNSSLAALAACALAYQDAERAVADGLHDTAIAEQLQQRLRAIDAAATEDHDRSFWLVRAEEVGYGL